MPLRWLKGRMREAIFQVVRRFLASNEGRNMLAESLRGRNAAHLPDLDLATPSPYGDLGRPLSSGPREEGEGAIFVTGRFRSGSTLIWNLFRHMRGFTSYYEPLNERRWFDPATRGDRVDPTHRQVEDYWAEYDGLAELGRHYRLEWISRDLYMDEQSWDDDLLAFTRILIAGAKGRAVLQFNRVDFRLAWFRRHFPRCKIVHIYRHPRDQWCSSLLDLKRFPPQGSVKEFGALDSFYLLWWCRDLRVLFPFLAEETAEHPYQLFFYLWKLSYLFGQRQADHSLSMEQLVTEPETELRRLLAATDIDPATQDLNALVRLIEKPRFGKWKEYAPDEWFRRHEETCEKTLADFFRRGAASGPSVMPGVA